MAVVTLKTLRASLALENGRDTSGVMKYVSLGMGSMSKDGFDDDKALAIKTALSPVLTKTIGYMTKTATSVVSAS